MKLSAEQRCTLEAALADHVLQGMSLDDLVSYVAEDLQYLYADLSDMDLLEQADLESFPTDDYLKEHS